MGEGWRRAVGGLIPETRAISAREMGPCPLMMSRISPTLIFFKSSGFPVARRRRFFILFLTFRRFTS
ncbi:MAG: hypothetical protein M1553_09960 [Firmicutes bacterium]|nr:hypothetical protein [Bacillota bacterium]